MESFQAQQITGNNEKAIQGILTYINFNRTGKLTIILFLINFILLFIDYINKAEGLWVITDGILSNLRSGGRHCPTHISRLSSRLSI